MNIGAEVILYMTSPSYQLVATKTELGDLKKLGWAVFCSHLIGDLEESLICNICDSGQWKTISQKRVMKYKSSSTRPTTWNSELLSNFRNNFKSLVLDQNLGTNNYDIHNLNKLKHHYNYRP